MFSLRYPAVIRQERGGGRLVHFPDLNGARTSGDDLADALVQAADCLAEAVASRIKYKLDIPAPTEPKRGMRMIDVPLELAEKAAVYLAMRAAGVNNSELARLMGVRETIVRRILDPKNATRPETIRKALACLGKTVTLTLNAA
ncbi:MAG: type II toxin-antitoxin system HicB family antitoxin [Bryobacterales bacterium]